MDGLVLEWLNLAFRWFHVVAGIAWIGASFYFIWLDLSLRTPPQWKSDKGVKGDLWAIHGGGIYEVAKYQLRPEKMPENLHWFKWEAYSTWLSGTGLMIVLYYLQAQNYLVGTDRWLAEPSIAVLASVSFIVGGQLLYEGLLRTPLVQRGLIFAACLLAVLMAASWLAHQLFSDRAAFLHVGALMATWMAGNVFFGIIPAQKKFVAAVSHNQPPDPQLALFAKLRSTHNNYLTLPVIFCMISNHYPFLYGHSHGWLAVILIGTLLAWGRHFFNLKHQGQIKPLILVSAAVGMIGVAVGLAHTDKSNIMQASAGHTSDVQIQQWVTTHCANCHAQTPTQPGFSAPPAGIIIQSPQQLAAHATKALPALQSGYMPLGNFHQFDAQQRQQMMNWLLSQQDSTQGTKP
ncbi:urate hydroxylase PuuD [Echinimonas agarilytica]|uniref:Urate hydroxylase PuuD n=1 Tax=Echinimonas agarilytica TaxID=1215918 RepID=A0AA41W6X7_9GAMM|nr:urate hydroxylase PuuD [Echinimonas agarilytica]MCM2680220.1 urate hydroxylase PuuD [Echinimonas agarilytica]